MKKTYRLVGVLLVLLLNMSAGVGTAAEDANEPAEEKQTIVIGSIEVTGNHSITSSEILSKVHSRVGQVFDPAGASEDAKRIAEIRGILYCYYNTAVLEGKVQLTFAVVEKNIISSIVFEGNRRYKAKTLRGKLMFKTGDYLDPVMASVGVRTLKEFYKNEGFAFVKVELDGSQLTDGKVVYKVDEGPRVRVASVKIKGNKALRTGDLAKVLKTKTRKYIVLQGYYNEDKIEEDLLKLQDAYQKRSYLDAKVTASREFNKERSKVRITFEIDEGKAYRVDKIRITGVQQLAEDKLRSVTKSKEGRPYNELQAQSDAKKLGKLYKESGFVNAKVEQRRIFVSEGTVDVAFEITEGERFRIGQIDIVGNEQTQDRAVRRVLDEYDFQPGEWYNADMARGDGSGELEKRVQRMVVAESATITPMGQTPGQKDAQVHIVEGQTGLVMIGAGIGSDSGVIGQFVFEQQNFDISDKPENFTEFITAQAFKGGGQNLRVALQPGTEVSEYSVSFTDPYIKDKPMSLDVLGSSWERFRESYDESRLKGYVGLEERFKNRWRESISFRAENVGVDDLDDDAPQEIIDVKGDNALAGVRLGVRKDTTDDMYNPGKGYIFDTGYEQVGGDFTFGILGATYRWYTTLHEDLAEQRTILGTKIYAATTVSDAPPFEKFYAGGQGTLRGFEYRGVSTRGLQTNMPSPERKDPIGSDWIFLANTEVTVPVVGEKFAALFFVDSGTIDTGPYRVSIGTGLQIQLPQWFGPVPMRFELGFPLIKGNEDDTQVFSFSVGRLF